MPPPGGPPKAEATTEHRAGEKSQSPINAGHDPRGSRHPRSTPTRPGNHTQRKRPPQPGQDDATRRAGRRTAVVVLGGLPGRRGGIGEMFFKCLGEKSSTGKTAAAYKIFLKRGGIGGGSSGSRGGDEFKVTSIRK